MKIISQKLYIKVAVAIALVALAVSLLAAALSYYFGLQNRQETNYLVAEKLYQTVESTAVLAARTNDLELADNIGLGLLNNDLVAGVKLFNDTGLDLVVGNISATSQRMSTTLFDPDFSDEPLGTLEIYLDQAYMQSTATLGIKRDIFILVALSFILTLFVSMFVHRKLTKPIQHLIDSVAEIDPESPSTMRMLVYKNTDEIGKLVTGINALMHKLHHSLNIERDLRKKTQVLEGKFRLIYEQASAGICLIDDKDMISSFNPAFAAYFTATDEQGLSSKHFPSLLSNRDKLQPLLREIRNKSSLEQVALDIECRVGDQEKWMHCLFAKVTDQRAQKRADQGALVQVILYDITERAERELQTRFEADHDPLTHLLNRRSGEKKLHKMLFHSIKQDAPFVMMMVDLDKFKPINDQYGHEAGDTVLIEVAHRITQQFNRDNEVCIRWGGDEFVVAFIAPEAVTDTIKKLAQEMLLAIQQPIRIQGDLTCIVDASIGLVMAPQHGSVLHELLVNADNTMYKVKEQGRGRVQFFSAD